MPYKKNLLLLGVLLALNTALPAQAEGFLRADGTRIVDERGEPVILRGMGLGGWMLQEGYMLKVGKLGQQHVIRARIEKLIGAQKTAEFYRAWLANHVREEDIRAMADWGYNSVRLPMHFNLFTLPVEQEPVPGAHTWLDTGFVLTDQLLAWCRKYGLYLILDLHAAPGGQGSDFAISDRDPDRPSLWDSEANRAKTIALWRKLAERYKNEPAIAAYDLINEPNWGFADAADKHGCAEKHNRPLRELLVDITRAIRSVDQKHMVIIEGNCWGNNYDGVLPPWDDNLVISFHKYWNDNNRESIAKFLALRDQYKVPLWLGESGENSNAWFADAIELVEREGIGWAFWPLKKIGFNNPLEVRANPGYRKLVDYWNGEGPRPSRSEAERALMQLAREDIRFENTLRHMDVVDAMLRQPHETETRPFKAHRISARGGRIAAVDYDLGRPGHAYADSDTANYHVSTGGERSLWNRGRVYRNDGVDIAATGSGFQVSDMSAGEWLQYTVEVESAGKYALRALLASASEDTVLNLRVNGAAPVALPLNPVKNNLNTLDTEAAAVELSRGTHRLVLQASAGTATLVELQLETTR